MPKKKTKNTRQGKILRDQQIIIEATKGKTATQIAKDLGMGRTQVSKVLNSDETKDFINERKQKMLGLIDNCIETLSLAVGNPKADMTNAVKAAITVLKTFGLVQEKMEMAHTFPKPTVILHRNGDKTILGSGE